ncbi:MAG: hypothetical protein V3V19_10985, partial [Cocleimonas sp.]
MRFFQIIIMVISTLLFMSACQSDTENRTRKSITNNNKVAFEVSLPIFKDTFVDESNNIASNTTDSSIKSQAEQMYLALSAELYNRLESPVQSALFYQKLVKSSDDATLARRATILAATNEQTEKALFNAQKWVGLRDSDLEANQYLALLLLRND